MKLIDSYSKVIIWASFFCVIMILSACSNKISMERFEGNSRIKKGETATLLWKFNKADYVVIDGFKESMPAEGTLNVKTDKTKTYQFTAINYFDTLKTDWSVQVIDEIQTGAEGASFPEMKESFLESEYLSGFAGAASDNLPNKIKVMRTSTSEGTSHNARFIALDQYGNYLRGLAAPDYHLNISSTNGGNIESNKLTENWTSVPHKTLNVTIMADNSSAADRNSEVLASLKEFSKEYRLVDNYTFAWFDHSPPDYMNLSKNDITSFDMIYDPFPAGFNSFCKHSYMYLDSVSGQKSDLENILILVLFSSDNSSIFIDASDLADMARKTNTAIYPIAIGTALNTHSLKYLADYSGGRFYFIDENSISKLKSIIHEIVFAQKSYFNLRFPINYKMPMVLSLQKGDSKIMDNFRIIDKPEPQFSDYQAIAGFNFKDTSIANSFLPAIEDLATLLKQNPTITIELTGHSGIEGNENYTYNIALLRAQNVRKLLLSAGVPSSQMRVVSEGSSKPIYYLEQLDWQSAYNRRVEVRWIIPEQLPYEILAEYCNSEANALEKVESWEKLGFKSYYERFLKNNVSTYRVKIWGFASIGDAEAVAEQLQAKYKIAMQVR